VAVGDCFEDGFDYRWAAVEVELKDVFTGDGLGAGEVEDEGAGVERLWGTGWGARVEEFPECGMAGAREGGAGTDAAVDLEMRRSERFECSEQLKAYFKTCRARDPDHCNGSSPGGRRQGIDCIIGLFRFSARGAKFQGPWLPCEKCSQLAKLRCEAALSMGLQRTTAGYLLNDEERK
jgi:hypothetical protein